MKIFKHLKSDWFRYGFETLAVVVGILVAFALDNWNESKKSADRANIFLNHISSNLSEDLEEIKTLMVHVDKAIDRSESLLTSFKTRSFNEFDATVFIGWLTIEKSFHANRSGVNALIYSGQLDLVIPELTYQLQQYYAICDKLEKREETSNYFIRENYEHFLFAHFIEGIKLADSYNIAQKYEDDPRPTILIDEAELIDNYQMEMRVLVRLVHSESEKELYTSLMEHATELRSEIDKLHSTTK